MRDGIEHRGIQLAASSRQRTEERRKGFFCGSGFPRPEPVEGQPRSYDFNDFNDFNGFNELTRICL